MNAGRQLPSWAVLNAPSAADGGRVVRRGQTHRQTEGTASWETARSRAVGARRGTEAFGRDATNPPQPQRQLAQEYFPQ
jgi:hypothetical protein